MFLPENYKDPKGSSNYLKLEEGNIKVRILSDVTTGWEYWTEKDNKRHPTRVRDYKQVPTEVRSAIDDKDKPKFFWMIYVWNYDQDKAQIFEITQITIRRTIENLYKDKSWGDPKRYDLSVTRTGEGFDTEYTVVPTPPTKFSTKGKDIPEIDMDKIFENGDPFEVDEKETPDETIEDKEIAEISSSLDVDMVEDPDA